MLACPLFLSWDAGGTWSTWSPFTHSAHSALHKLQTDKLFAAHARTCSLLNVRAAQPTSTSTWPHVSALELRMRIIKRRCRRRRRRRRCRCQRLGQRRLTSSRICISNFCIFALPCNSGALHPPQPLAASSRAATANIGVNRGGVSSIACVYVS